MRYYSTNDRSRSYSLREAVLLGLPPDNGLFMPEHIPALSSGFISSLRGLSLVDIGAVVSKEWFGQDIAISELDRMVMEAFPFDTPVVTIDERTHVLELFHGPTLAFKDVGARFMARLMSWLVKDSDRKLTILVATSGDTGSAVASGFFGVENIEVIILYPSGKVSPSQEKQLTTWGGNITALEVLGTFDDCQRMVKEAFLDAELQTSYRLTSANSINISRLVPQSFYYFRAVAQLEDLSRPVRFVVPSGNFGNLTAGILAKRMGLAVDRFIAATNLNDVIPEYLLSGDFNPRASVSTISNAMDVGNPSNFWRMKELYEGDYEAMKQDIVGYRVDEHATRAAMVDCHGKCGYVLEPHGAVGYDAWKRIGDDHRSQGIILETAHPAKFPDVIKESLGIDPLIPDRLATIVSKEKHSTLIPIGLAPLKDFLLSR
ncbi:MAG: threonine synthase [Bacteroidota bacterium]